MTEKIDSIRRLQEVGVVQSFPRGTNARSGQENYSYQGVTEAGFGSEVAELKTPDSVDAIKDQISVYVSHIHDLLDVLENKKEKKPDKNFARMLKRVHEDLSTDGKRNKGFAR